MAKPIRGSTEVDETLEKWLKQTTTIWAVPNKISKNLNQKTLRDIIFQLDIIRAHCCKHLDYRNEQGRGGLK